MDKAAVSDRFGRAAPSYDAHAGLQLACAVGLLEMAPQEVDQIEAVALEIIGELRDHPSAYYQRTRMRFERLDQAMQVWAKDKNARASLKKMADAMSRVCTQLPADSSTRQSCEGLFA